MPMVAGLFPFDLQTQGADRRHVGRLAGLRRSRFPPAASEPGNAAEQRILDPFPVALSCWVLRDLDLQLQFAAEIQAAPGLLQVRLGALAQRSAARGGRPSETVVRSRSTAAWPWRDLLAGRIWSITNRSNLCLPSRSALGADRQVERGGDGRQDLRSQNGRDNVRRRGTAVVTEQRLSVRGALRADSLSLDPARSETIRVHPLRREAVRCESVARWSTYVRVAVTRPRRAAVLGEHGRRSVQR